MIRGGGMAAEEIEVFREGSAMSEERAVQLEQQPWVPLGSHLRGARGRGAGRLRAGRGSSGRYASRAYREHVVERRAQRGQQPLVRDDLEQRRRERHPRPRTLL
eukprot:scaffold52289_cov35-Tisochrysis_lutea.AAC.2